ncbi:sigma 54 modulation/S30EA-like ribosomal protein [Kribbella sp. VKM Ac-2571]|uniref:sigma 54 modulation/S30EA ribosomal C-terminal domain-containing protein n=1 Tax=Kribbella sp. VKM Ac-2571 TaxID=2512222 RepID=UPI00105FC809|nr:sigma 54 modulation/S30EA ribosomal C-terminal domain-containing protein [Kribbella sp. VKM Ac-2571]TDO58795.1 sigma 54 modulation/S30EA-like ribosomal protein [Kribbella sp. VKM Ac-2571]
MSTESQVVLPLRPGTEIPVSTTGIVPTDAATVLHEHLAPILGRRAAYSRARLTRLAEPGLRRPLVAQIDVQLSAGHRVRVQLAAATMSELVAVLALRTIEQLRVYPSALAACLRGHVVTDLMPSPPELLPPERRRLARRKICRPAPMTVAEAIVVLNAMDYRFHLFREKFSRQDSIVVRSGLGRYRVIQSRPNPIGLEATTPIALSPAERRSPAEATTRLDLTGAPFDIFTNRATGRLHALYARYDGHYGLLGAEAAIRSTRRSW